MLGLLDSHMLDIDLCRFVCQLNLHLTAARSKPQEHLITVIQYHDVIVGEIILAKVGALFRHSEIALFVGTAEQPCVTHVFRHGIVRFASSERYPEEIFRFLSFVQNL